MELNSAQNSDFVSAAENICTGRQTIMRVKFVAELKAEHQVEKKSYVQRSYSYGTTPFIIA